MRLFGRKKEESAEAPEEAGQDDEPEKPPKRGKEAGTQKITANIEKLSAKVEALSELRKTDAERFSRISEQIGELRNLILEKEEEIKEVGIKATKASELVGALQPETIIAEMRRSAAKDETLEAKIEATKELYQKVIDDLRELRKKLAAFNGTEELIKLNSETSQNLIATKKTEANIERQANIVGNVFVQFQKQFSTFMKEKESATLIKEKLAEMLKDLDELKVKAKSALITKDDFDLLRAELIKKIEKTDNGPKKAAEDALIGSLVEIKQKLRAQEKEINEIKEELYGTKGRQKQKSGPERAETENSRNEEPNSLLEFNNKLIDAETAVNRLPLNEARRKYNDLRRAYMSLGNNPRMPMKELHRRVMKIYQAINKKTKQ